MSVESNAQLWETEAPRRYFLLPTSVAMPPGTLVIRTRLGHTMSVDEREVAPHEVTAAQAVRWTSANLPAALTDLRASLDDTLAGWRAKLDASLNEPVAPDTSVTANAVPALLDFLRALPGIVGQSISGSDARLASAREKLSDLQQQLAATGIELDERFTGYADRLADLRRDAEAKRSAPDLAPSIDHARDEEEPPVDVDPSNPGPSP
jgi:hypothetical protein